MVFLRIIISHFGFVFSNEFAYLNQNPLAFVKSAAVLNSQGIAH